jgi:hypothetical protein
LAQAENIFGFCTRRAVISRREIQSLVARELARGRIVLDGAAELEDSQEMRRPSKRHCRFSG